MTRYFYGTYRMQSIRFRNGFEYKNIIPKISDLRHLSVFKKILNKKGHLALDIGTHKTFYHNAPVNWIRAHSFIPYFKSERDGEKASTQLKQLKFNIGEKANAATSVICSSLFYLWWITISDCYNLNKPELLNFPLNFDENNLAKNLKTIEEKLKNDLMSKAVRRVYYYETSGKVEYDEFYMKKSKPIIDQIDTLLAQHYGFTHEELDFIINYDIKYRIGKELNSGEDNT